MRLKGYDYSQNGLYFVTICVNNRKHLLGHINNGIIELNNNGEIVRGCWLSITEHFPNVRLHDFVVMPNHIHGIIEITAHVDESAGVQNFEPLPAQPLKNAYQHIIPRSIGSIIRGFKIGATKQIGYSIWQRNYHERIIRDDESYNEIAEYIQTNPLCWNDDRYYDEVLG
jgi:REP element-mobilizing transposase RayT